MQETHWTTWHFPTRPTLKFILFFITRCHWAPSLIHKTACMLVLTKHDNPLTSRYFRNLPCDLDSKPLNHNLNQLDTRDGLKKNYNLIRQQFQIFLLYYLQNQTFLVTTYATVKMEISKFMSLAYIYLIYQTIYMVF